MFRFDPVIRVCWPDGPASCRENCCTRLEAPDVSCQCGGGGDDLTPPMCAAGGFPSRQSIVVSSESRSYSSRSLPVELSNRSGMICCFAHPTTDLLLPSLSAASLWTLPAESEPRRRKERRTRSPEHGGHPPLDGDSSLTSAGLGGPPGLQRESRSNEENV